MEFIDLKASVQGEKYALVCSDVKEPFEFKHAKICTLIISVLLDAIYNLRFTSCESTGKRRFVRINRAAKSCGRWAMMPDITNETGEAYHCWSYPAGFQFAQSDNTAISGCSATAANPNAQEIQA